MSIVMALVSMAFAIIGLTGAVMVLGFAVHRLATAIREREK